MRGVQNINYSMPQGHQALLKLLYCKLRPPLVVSLERGGQDLYCYRPQRTSGCSEIALK